MLASLCFYLLYENYRDLYVQILCLYLKAQGIFLLLCVSQLFMNTNFLRQQMKPKER